MSKKQVIVHLVAKVMGSIRYCESGVILLSDSELPSFM